MLFVFLLKMVECPEAPPLMGKKNKTAVGKPHRYISTLSQWLKLVSGGCMHLSLKRFSSSGSAWTCLSESHREPLFQGTDNTCLRVEVQAKVSLVEVLLVWGTSPRLGLFAPLVVPKVGPIVCSWRLARVLWAWPHPALSYFQDPFNSSLTHMAPAMTICNPVSVRKNGLYLWEFWEHLWFVVPGPEPIFLYRRIGGPGMWQAYPIKFIECLLGTSSMPGTLGCAESQVSYRKLALIPTNKRAVLMVMFRILWYPKKGSSALPRAVRGC